MRKCLNDVLEETKEWFINTYWFHKKDLDHFPSLDDLIYHTNGWTLDKSIEHHYNAYNKWRKKDSFSNALSNILYLESDRLRNTVFDTLNEKNVDRFEYVTITGDNCCESDSGICDDNYNTYRVGSHVYELPPYHWGCHCYAIYHDNPSIKAD